MSAVKNALPLFEDSFIASVEKESSGRPIEVRSKESIFIVNGVSEYLSWVHLNDKVLVKKIDGEVYVLTKLTSIEDFTPKFHIAYKDNENIELSLQNITLCLSSNGDCIIRNPNAILSINTQGDLQIKANKINLETLDDGVEINTNGSDFCVNTKGLP